MFVLKNISKLESMVNQIKKNSKDIQVFLNDIETMNLYHQPAHNADDSLLQCKVNSKRFRILPVESI